MENASPHVRNRRPRWRRPLRLTVGLLVTGAVTMTAVTAYAGTVQRPPHRSANTGGKATAEGNKATAEGNGGVAFNNAYRMVDPSYNPHRRMPAISFLTVDDPADPTFNQLLGINDRGTAAGYFGSGADAKHPNKGYLVGPDYDRDDFTNQNFPGSVQTQVIGINNAGTTVGFFVNATKANLGFVRWRGAFLAVANPATTAKPAVNQLLGVNNNGVAAGFYNDAAGASHGYLYWIQKRSFVPVRVPVKADSVVASGINDRGDVSGFYTVGKRTSAFVLTRHSFISINLGGKTNTQALGLNNKDQVVGSFVDAHGKMHGFVWRNWNLTQVDNPNGSGGTLVNGIDNRNQIVGFFVDAKGNTNGFVARLRS